MTEQSLTIDEINALDHADKLYRVTDAIFGAVMLRNLCDRGYLTQYGTVAGFNAYKLTPAGRLALTSWMSGQEDHRD